MASKMSDTINQAYTDLLDTDAGRTIMGALTPPTVQEADKQAAQMGKLKLQSKSMVEIINTDYPPLIQPVQGLIAEGATMLVGASKIGKSWFVLAMCLGVAAGKPFLGKQTLPGFVLYLALEDTEATLKDRTLKISKALDLDISSMFHCQVDAPTVKDGLIDVLQTWIDDHQPCRVIVIDTLQKVRGITGGRANAYETDSDFLTKFKHLGDRNHIAVILTHHTNKSKDTGDPFDRVNGSTGLMGTADTTIMMTRKRDAKEGSLTFTGRNIIERKDMILSFDGGIWGVLGADADEFKERRQYNSDPVVHLIKDLLRDHPHGVRISYVDALRESMARYNAYVAETPRALSVKVKKIIDDLLFFDNISVETGVSLGGESKGLAIAPRLKIIENPTEQISI